MTSDEQAFRSGLRASPGDENARLAYADWLCDHGREAEGERQKLMLPGYRVLVQLEREPRDFDVCFGFKNDATVSSKRPNDKCGLPVDWWKRLKGDIILHPEKKNTWVMTWKDYSTALEATDAAALAFARLGGKKRTWLLNLAEKFASRKR